MPFVPVRLVSRVSGIALFFASLVAPPVSHAGALTPDLTLSLDARLRYENDWDSHTAAGARRVDRERGRVRLRAALGYTFSSVWSVGARVRTGHRQSQQSPHLTFTADDGPSDDFRVSLDRAFLQFKDAGFTVWAGRSSLPFWQQNELVWDEDITPTGFAGTYDRKLATGTLTAAAGAFQLPDGMTRLHGELFAGQLKYTRPVAPAQLTLATSLYAFAGAPGARFLRNRNGERDYLIGVASAQWTTPVAGRSLAVGLDVLHNFENYGAADAAPLAPVNADETTGYVWSALYGQLRQARDWQVGYFYARIGTLAVNASYAQDDWARFGNGTQSDLSDFKGHELRAGYAFTKDLNLVARAFFVDAITTVQDGKRFRVDLNWKW